MTPDQRLRRRFTYVAELPERPRGWGHEYDQVVDWLIARYGSSSADRWNILGLQVYFHNKADRDAFCEAWRAVPL
jgi:hypothetical protein